MANRIQGTTGLVGLIGNPLKHSRSPHMHNSAFERLGLDYVYLCFEVPEDGLADSMRALKTFNAIGSNITFPFKQEVLQYLVSELFSPRPDLLQLLLSFQMVYMDTTAS